jgi:predicted metal-dependent peptidase
MNAQQKMAKAIGELIIDQRFYGTLIYSTKIEEAVQVGGFPIDTMATNGKTIYYNPSFVDGLTLGEAKGVLCHEVMHIANAHHLRRGKRDQRLWNIACDYAINPLVMKSKLHLPSDALVNPTYENMSAEEIYLREEQREKTEQEARQQMLRQINQSDRKTGTGQAPNDYQPAPQDDQPEASEKAAEGGQGSSSPQPSAKQEGPSAPPKPSSVGMILDGVSDEGEPLSEAEMQEEMANVRTVVIQAAQIAQMAGQDSAGFERLVAEAKDPRDDWKETLRRFIQQSVIVPQDSTWSRPNRRFLSADMYLPSRKKEDNGTLLIAVDTSGSIDDLILGHFLAEMKRILEDTDYETVTVMACDSKVRWHGTFNKGEEVEYRMRGGGGTAFAPVWAKAEELDLKPSACVYFTDLECHSFGEEPSYPVLWAAWGSRADRFMKRLPFGEAIKVEPK